MSCWSIGQDVALSRQRQRVQFPHRTQRVGWIGHCVVYRISTVLLILVLLTPPRLRKRRWLACISLIESPYPVLSAISLMVERHSYTVATVVRFPSWRTDMENAIKDSNVQQKLDKLKAHIEYLFFIVGHKPERALPELMFIYTSIFGNHE